MTTGSIFSNITNKRILGLEDFKDRMIDYFRTLNVDSVKAKWDIDGVFNVKLGMAGANDIVSATGTSLSTAGDGHILDIANIEPDASAQFENTLGILYSVGMSFAEAPDGIIINPRTGLPEYLGIKEMIGVKADPTSVVDNGNGTLTVDCDSVTESGVSNAGRTVRVFLKVPAAGGLTALIAIEDVVLDLSNEGTTAAALGQSTISTTASDYSVVLLGISVSRNLDLETSPTHFFIGRVTGVGAGSTPTVFDTSQQRILKTFVDATQITVDNSNFGDDPPVPEGDTGGIGPVITVQQGFDKVDDQLARRRAWSAVVIGDEFGAPTGTVRTLGDFAGVNALKALEVSQGAGGGLAGGSFFLSAGRHEVNDDWAILDHPFVFGERGYDSGAPAQVKIGGVYTANADIPGTWQRIAFDTTSMTDPFVLVAKEGTLLEDCKFSAGGVRFNPANSSSSLPMAVRDCLFIGGTLQNDEEQLFASPGSGHMVIENTIFRGISTSATTATGNLKIANVGGLSANVSDSVTFRNCIFESEKDLPAVHLDSSSNITFEGCSFYGPVSAGSTHKVVKIEDCANIVLRNCKIQGTESGSCIEITASSFLLDNVHMFSGDSAGNDNPQIMSIDMIGSAAESPGIIRNCRVEFEFDKGGVGQQPNLRFLNFLVGSSSIALESDLIVDGLYIRMNASADLPAQTIMYVQANDSSLAVEKGAVATFNNVTIDVRNRVFNVFELTQDWALIHVAGVTQDGAYVLFNNTTLKNMSSIANTVLLENIYGILTERNCILKDTRITGGGGGTGPLIALLQLGARCTADGVYVHTLGSGPINLDGDDSQLLNVRLDDYNVTSAAINVNGTGCRVDGVFTETPPVSASVIRVSTGSLNRAFIRNVTVQDGVWGSQRIIDCIGQAFLEAISITVASGSDVINGCEKLLNSHIRGTSSAPVVNMVGGESAHNTGNATINT